MVDRVPTNPGRVQLVPVSGQENVFDLTMADGATVEGTPLNKLTLLQDATAAAIAALYESSPVTPATPDAALACLAELLAPTAKCEKGTYTGTGTWGSSFPNTLTFGAKPMLVIVLMENNGRADLAGLPLVMINAMEHAVGVDSLQGAGQYGVEALTWSGNSVSWYNEAVGLIYGRTATINATSQYNRDGYVYHYIAFTMGGATA